MRDTLPQFEPRALPPARQTSLTMASPGWLASRLPHTVTSTEKKMPFQHSVAGVPDQQDKRQEAWYMSLVPERIFADFALAGCASKMRLT